MSHSVQDHKQDHVDTSGHRTVMNQRKTVQINYIKRLPIGQIFLKLSDLYETYDKVDSTNLITQTLYSTIDV